MFYWENRDSVDSVGNMSKVDILREIVNEKLVTAAREILAVVERTVAGYEEEVSGFREEIDRQRRQLEAFQPKVKLERPGLSDTGNLGLTCCDDEDESSEQPALIFSSSQDEPTDPDCQIISRFVPERRNPGSPQPDHTQDRVVLRVRLLEDSQCSVLSNHALKNSCLQEVSCPCGLQEANFLDLLRSTFPQLSGGELFDILTTDRSKKLQPLKLKMMTPEEIDRSLRSTGAEASVLYIRPKRHRNDTPDCPSTSAMTAADPSKEFTVGRSGRRRGRPRRGEEQRHHLLRVCILEDSQSDVLSSNVFLKSPVQEVKCARGLQEASFLELLKSTFPQIAGDKPFDIFRTDRSRRLRRLKLKAMTPEEMSNSMKSSGAGRGTAFYIRMKGREEEIEDPTEKCTILKGNCDVTNGFPSTVVMKSDEAGLCLREGNTLDASSTSQNQGNIATVEGGGDPGVSEPADPSSTSMACSEAESCPDSSDTDEHVDRDDDWKPNASAKEVRDGDSDLQSTNKSRKARAKGLCVDRKVTQKNKSQCKVCGISYMRKSSLIQHAQSHVGEPERLCSVCGQRFESAEELEQHLNNHQQISTCSYCGKSFFTVIGLKHHVTVHTGERPHKCDVCQKSFALKSQLKAHSRIHSSEETFHCQVCGKTFRSRGTLRRHRLTHTGERRYGCNVCSKRFKLLQTLKAHEKIHTARDRSYLCHVCCKAFFTEKDLAAHMRTHTNERPFICGVCGMGCLTSGDLKIHLRVHTGERPYGCSECHRFFKRKTHLNTHVMTHSGVKPFFCGVCGKAVSRQEHLTVHMRTHNGERPYHCTLCGKSFTQSHCLKSHMKSHHAEENSPMDHADP
ncbi:zinc finger protein 835-like isoform X2 [Thalassophryne amazonica]|uniref:zinc finger protein 835-like isoform X2 n=1 Tax=Thalassophryne amazonica TaxID=390379 RepID=UPI001471D632|nr:zinc finger protein 835-like isoform X2 [Thalassophryne amazonica]